MSRAHVCDIEKGRKQISPGRAAKFAQALGYPEIVSVQLAVTDLLRREGLNYKVTITPA